MPKQKIKELKRQRYQQNGKESQLTTMYIKNRRYDAEFKVFRSHQILYLTESLVLRNRLFFIY